MDTKAFLQEAVARFKKADCDVLYLHPDNVGQAECAIVSLDWINRLMKAESAAHDALDDFPDTSNHDHLTDDD